jgi:hypothetical protein
VTAQDCRVVQVRVGCWCPLVTQPRHAHVQCKLCCSLLDWRANHLHQSPAGPGSGQTIVATERLRELTKLARIVTPGPPIQAVDELQIGLQLRVGPEPCRPPD